jgi:hypothetical protein
VNLAATHHADLEPIVPGDALLSVSLSADGDLVALWSAPNGAVRITMYGALLLELPALDLAFPTAHLMPGDTILTVGARARNPLHHNAIHHAADGTVITTARFGDAIEHVVTTHTGDVWVGYFDEGAPAGLRRFGPDLRLAWTYDAPVIDCYALNVTDRAVWTCYHPGSPLVRVQHDRATAWRNPVSGVHALAVAGHRAGLLCALDRLVLGDLHDDEFHPAGEHRLTLPGGVPLPDDATVMGRGHELHVVTGKAWYRLDIAASVP